MLSEGKKHKMMVAGSVALILGFFLFLVFWSVTNNWFALVIIPVAGLIGLAQAYLTPELDD